jgi:mRNA-degrading endonuclease RelE of RelBE toxin-antitoxin system
VDQGRRQVVKIKKSCTSLTDVRQWRILIITNPIGVYAEMIFIETSIFTRQALKLLTDDEYRELQQALVDRSDAGAVMVGSGGLRKIRWAKEGRGKRGGVRVIYYWAVSSEQILMLFMYPKGEQDDLTSAQIKMLRQIVEEEYP